MADRRTGRSVISMELATSQSRPGDRVATLLARRRISTSATTSAKKQRGSSGSPACGSSCSAQKTGCSCPRARRRHRHGRCEPRTRRDPRRRARRGGRGMHHLGPGSYLAIEWRAGGSVGALLAVFGPVTTATGRSITTSGSNILVPGRRSTYKKCGYLQVFPSWRDPDSNRWCDAP